MTATVKNTATAVLGSSMGYSLYHWWRHGRVDWVGVLEFALGFDLATLAEQGIARWWQTRKRHSDKRPLAHQE